MNRPEATGAPPGRVRREGSEPRGPGRPVGFPAGFFDRGDPRPTPVFYATAPSGHPHRRRRHRGRRRALRRARHHRRRARPHGLVGLALPRGAADLTVLGMNAGELAANPQAAATVVHDLNADPQLPFADGSFDAAVCCVSVDYLVRPVEVFADVARTLRPGVAVRFDVFQSLLPDQGDPRLAGVVRRTALRDRRPLLPTRGGSTSRRSSGALPRRTGATRCTRSGPRRSV